MIIMMILWKRWFDFLDVKHEYKVVALQSCKCDRLMAIIAADYEYFPQPLTIPTKGRGYVELLFVAIK